MTLDEVYKILKPARIDPEEPDYEETYYNGNKSEIRYAIDNDLLKPEDLSDTTLYNWINDGIGDEDLLAKITQHKKEKKEEVRLKNQEKRQLPYDDEYDDYEFEEDDDYEKLMEESAKAMEAHKEELRKAAEQSILPQNANIKETWGTRIKKFIKEKVEVLKNHFQEKLER